MAESIASGNSRPSKILLEELFASEDDRFLDIFIQFDSYQFLKTFSNQWIVDQRPWARKQLLRYLQLPLNFPGHEVVVKQTMKSALEKGDDELLIHHMVMLDRLVRRSRIKTYSYDYRARQSFVREYLFACPNKTVRNQSNRFQEYTYLGRKVRVTLPDIRNRARNRLFSQRTRFHLRRRIWRHFRFMAYQDSERYVEAITSALALYEDSFFDSGEAILDNWSLMHACYFCAPEISFTESHTNIVRGQSLATLKASPYRPEAWTISSTASKLWNLLANARSQFVRMWTIEMLRNVHGAWLENVSIHELIPLLSSGDATVAEFAVELFQKHRSLSKVDIATWLSLLDGAEFSVLPIICEAMKSSIDPARLSDEQLVDLTTARPASIAKLGLVWLQQRHEQHPLSTDHLRRLASARCEWEANAIADWAIVELTQPERYSAEYLSEFFDAKSAAIRFSACQWLTSVLTSQTSDQTLPTQHDPHLWLMLIETPYDEVRFSLLDLLGDFLDKTPEQIDESISVDQYVRILSAVVLCVNRGSRNKPKAINQLSALAIRNPEKSDVVIPVLAIAARSIRDPEKAAGLSGLATIISQHPTLAAQVEGVISEWQWQE